MWGITWDIGIGLVLAGILTFTLLIRKHKALSMLVSTYIAFFVSESWAGPVTSFFKGERTLFSNFWVQANVNQYTVSLTLFFSFIILLSMFVKLSGKRSRYSAFEVVTYGVSTTALWLIFILQVMPPSLKNAVLQASQFAPVVYDWRDYVLAVPLFLMIYFGIYHNEEL